VPSSLQAKVTVDSYLVFCAFVYGNYFQSNLSFVKKTVRAVLFLKLLFELSKTLILNNSASSIIYSVKNNQLP
jgi:hypothetical protein